MTIREQAELLAIDMTNATFAERIAIADKYLTEVSLEVYKKAYIDASIKAFNKKH